MVTRAIVEQIIDKCTVKVRIPTFNRMTSTNIHTTLDDLYDAKICTLSNYDPCFTVGDAVIVAFEDNTRTRPIIIGYLYHSSDRQPSADFSVDSLNCQSLNVTGNTILGPITQAEISCLQGVKANLQAQILNLEERLSNLEKTLLQPPVEPSPPEEEDATPDSTETT